MHVPLERKLRHATQDCFYIFTVHNFLVKLSGREADP